LQLTDVILSCIATALKNVTALLQEAGLGSAVHHKEQFIDKDTMSGGLSLL